MVRSEEPSRVGPLRGPALLAWALAAVCVAAAFAGLYLDAADGGPVQWKWAVVAVGISVPGALIAAARPRALLGWLFLAVALNNGAIGLAEVWLSQHGLSHLEVAAVAVWYRDRFAAFAMPLAMLALILLPDSRLPSARWRIPVTAAVLVQVVLVAVWSFSRTPAAGPDSAWPDEIAALKNPLGVLPAAWAEGVSDFGWLLTVPLVLAVAAMVVRLRSSRGDDRSRLVMLLLALGVLVGAIVAGGALPAPAAEAIEILASLFFAVVLVSAVLRRQLDGVQVAVHRAFVFTALGAVVLVLYVVTVGALSAAGPELSPFGAGVVAAVAALVVLPLRARVQRWVDRLMYGDRRDPFHALTRLAERTHGAPSLDGVLSAVASSMATSLRAPFVKVEAFGVRSVHPPGAGPEAGDGPGHQAELLVGDRQVGSIHVTLQPGRRLSPDEQRLVAVLGRHAGIAVDAVHLAEQVAEHHRALVTAREEERRRLGRELHDGLGPTVAGISMQLGALRPLVRSDPDAVIGRLARLEEAAAGALLDIRRVAHELRPPVLDQVGLAHAVRQVGDSMNLVPVAEAVEHGPLPAAVEVAAYRICAEALANVAHHSGSRTYRIQLQVIAGSLVVVVEDDGVGPGAAPAAGLGLSTMRERAEELGGTLTVRPGPTGGTVVTAVLPLIPSLSAGAATGGRP